MSESNIWFSSDHHFGHENIIKYCGRPFDNARNMNWVMTERWNEVVKSNDTIYYLGDFAMGNQSELPRYLEKLNGYKVLVRGNHDRTVERMLEGGFNEVHDNVVVEVKGRRLWLNHYPVRSEDGEQGKRRPEAPGAYDIALCGHIHEKWMVRDGCVNVGVDVWNFRPISLREIEDVRQAAGQGC